MATRNGKPATERHLQRRRRYERQLLWLRDSKPGMSYWELTAHDDESPLQLRLVHFDREADSWRLDFDNEEEGPRFHYLNELRAVHFLLGQLLVLAEKIVPKEPGHDCSWEAREEAAHV